ncbi:anti-sigma-K factor RskA [Lewinella marina]|uniref:Anti-sigma factor n=1 Tax=Neolewinella marina TaxID=438751 RepID=A0A2G0CBR6_9BACT|nr:hypothetical protein [Neolewinella marina]NJB87060.1 anti-sigma-K factor RskA [Neolewinella marina]PHK97405.1 hypothetical protein CGL56_16515 [Neolewinella marina]
MNREELKRSGLLDQYVLGLLGPERNAEVEQMIAEDPFLAQEVDRLRTDLDAYADARDITSPSDGRTPRTAQEFLDLDHEMITSMMEHNHTLNIWRYVLVGICLLLVGVSGYLFRLKEELRSDLVKERSLHAQDEASYRMDLENNRAALAAYVSNWDSLETVTHPLDTGSVQLHLLPWAEVVLVDLAGMAPPAAGHAYYVFPAVGRRVKNSPEVINADNVANLHAVEMTDKFDHIRIYLWETGRKTEPKPGESPIAIIPLH